MVRTKLSRLLAVGLVLIFTTASASGIALAQNHNTSLTPSIQNSNAPSDPAITSSGPTGGTIIDLKMDPQHPTTLYAASDYGVFKSTNNGDLWAPTNLLSTQVYALAIDPLHTDTIYAGTRSLGFFKSTDGGITWNKSGDALISKQIIYTIAVDPVDPNNIYAGGRGSGVDGTTSGYWGGGAFKSSDSGLTWQDANVGLPEGWIYTLAINPVTPNIIYAGTHSKGVFKSFDGGLTWAARNGGLANFPPALPLDDNLKIRSLSIDPQNPDLILVGVWGGNSLFMTTNGAERGWANITKGIYGKHVRTVAIDPYPGHDFIFYAGFDLGGVYHNGETGAGNWAALPGQWGYFNVINAIVINPTADGTIFLAVEGAGVYRSTDGGGNWKAVNQGLTATTISAIKVDSKDPNHIYAATYGTGLFESRDHGVSWTSKVWPDQWDWMTSLAIDPNTPNTLYAGTDNYGIAVSLDNGATWNQINKNIPNTIGINPLTADRLDAGPLSPDLISGSPDIRAVAAAPTIPTSLYAGTWGHGIWYSKDGGNSWSTVDNTLALVTSILVYPNDPNSIVAATANVGLFKASLSAGSFTVANLTSGLASVNVKSTLIDTSTSPATLYAGTTTGLYQSIDNGATWSLFALAGHEIDSLAIDPANKNVFYAGTQDDGIYKTIYVGAGAAAYWFRLAFPTTTVKTLTLDPITNDVLLVGTSGGGLESITQSKLMPTVFITNLFIRVVPAPTH